jgi:hypothetical protein
MFERNNLQGALFVDQVGWQPLCLRSKLLTMLCVCHVVLSIVVGYEVLLW